MKLICWSILSISLMACSRNYTLSPEDFKGVKLETPYPPSGYTAKIKAKSICPSFIRIRVNDVPLIFRYSGEADTSFRVDYYGDSAFVKVDYDSCTVEVPEIKLVFY